MYSKQDEDTNNADKKSWETFAETKDPVEDDGGSPKSKQNERYDGETLCFLLVNPFSTNVPLM